MSAVPIWVAAVSLLTPFVKKAGEKVAEKAGEALFKALEQRFARDKDKKGGQVLKEYAEDPNLYDQTLAKLLEQRAGDQSFRTWLEEVVAQAQTEGGTVSQENIRQNAKVSGHGRTGDIVGKVGRDFVKGKGN